jgi:hypothetical protein
MTLYEVIGVIVASICGGILLANMIVRIYIWLWLRK